MAIGGCFCLVISILLFTACTKTGAAGANGATGATGATGAQGPAGAAGPAGSRIYKGSGAPADTLGLVGDYYIDASADSLYGPKTLAGWGTAISLQGAQGATGTAGSNGSTILSGSTSPALSIGSPGDYYFDNVTDSLYGPKTRSGWGTAVSLRGAAGSANVIYYNWVSFANLSWSVFDPLAYRRGYPVSMPAITSDIFEQGVVLVYMKEEVYSLGSGARGDVIIQVPAEFNNQLNATKQSLTDEIQVGSLRFYLSDALDTNDPGTLGDHFFGGNDYFYFYRIVIIPGGVMGTGVDPRQMSYQDVCSRFHIQP